MNIDQFSKFLQKLENTSKRLEITDILLDLIENLSNDEIDKAIYLSQGYLNAKFDNPKFNVAEKMMIKAIAQAVNKNPEEVEILFKQLGDLGDTCEQLHDSKKDCKLSIANIHEALLEIAHAKGTGSQEVKITKTAQLLQNVDALSAKYITRTILGTMRLGFSELTVIDALVLLIEGKKDSKTKKYIEQKYNKHPDIGIICKKIKISGIKGIENLGISTGIPIMVQKPQRVGSMQEIIDKMSEIWAEYKFDGTRVQLHLDKNKTKITTTLFDTETQYFIKTFTRNLEDSSHQFPDILKAALKQVGATSIILDGEAIGIDVDTGEFLEFQKVMQRKRKHDIKEMAKKIPLKYFVFDILYKNGEDLTILPLQERRKILESTIKDGDVLIVDEKQKIETKKDLESYFKIAKNKGLEGLILKNPKTHYLAGGRSFAWIKLKVADMQLLDDSVDVVVLGYYVGKGVRTQFGIGGFLAGIYDKKTNTFKSITKVGTGLTDEDFKYLKNLADKYKTNTKPKDYNVDKTYTPDVWLSPKIVVELGADEISVSKTHSAGFALRFPRLIKFRQDKDAYASTTVEEIHNLYNIKKRGYY